jgi:superfamily II DNA/RNA helicase
LFAEFRNGRSPILVATDVAARGLGQFIINIDKTRLIDIVTF